MSAVGFRSKNPDFLRLQEIFYNHAFPEIHVEEISRNIYIATTNLESWFMADTETPTEDMKGFRVAKSQGSTPAEAILNFAADFQKASENGEFLVTSETIPDYKRLLQLTYKFDGNEISPGDYFYIDGEKLDTPKFD